MTELNITVFCILSKDLLQPLTYNEKIPIFKV